MGNSNGDRMTPSTSRAPPARQLWRDYIKSSPDTPASDWPRPANVVNGTVVSAPGAYGDTAPASSCAYRVLHERGFIKGTEPAKVDDWFVAGAWTYGP